MKISTEKMNKTIDNLFCLPQDAAKVKQPMPLNLDFELIIGSETDVPTGHSTGWRTMPFDLCTCGTGVPRDEGVEVLIKGEKPIRLTGNPLIFIPAGVTHRLNDFGNTPRKSLWVHFRTTFWQEYDIFSFLRVPPIAIPSPEGPVAEHLWNLIRQPEILNTAQTIRHQLYGIALSLELLRLAERNGLPALSDPGEGERRLLPALRLLNRAERKPSIAELAALVHLSPSRFQALFAAKIGISPGQYYKRILFGRACRLLTCSELSIAECADRLGFADPYHFSREFRSYCGEPPSSYRRRLQKSGAGEGIRREKEEPGAVPSPGIRSH